MDANDTKTDPDFRSRVLDEGSDGSVPAEVDGLDVARLPWDCSCVPCMSITDWARVARTSTVDSADVADFRLSATTRAILAGYGIDVPAVTGDAR